MWERQGGIFGVLVFAMVAVAFSLLLLFFMPIAAILTTGMGIGGALSSCVPGSGGQTSGSEVTNALDVNTSLDDSRPVVDALPDDLAIPENYLEAYQSAAESYGMDWEILAAVGWRETRHGTYEPGWEENSAQAMGPMQFIPAAWEHHGVYADGSSGTPPLENRNNLADAVASAANKLTDQGINTDEVEALFRYNNAMWYVNEVQDQANIYRSGNYTVVDGDGGVSSAGNEGGFNLLPASLNFDLECTQFSTVGMAVGEAPDEITQAAVLFALEQVGKPYCWGGTGPSCYDCSGLLYAAYKDAGVLLPARISQDLWNVGPRVEENDVLPGDLVFFRVNVEGRSDADRGNPGHVGMVVGPGEMVEAWCTSCGPIAVRDWEDRDVMGFTRPLLDPRLSEHVTGVPEYEASGEETGGMAVASGVYGVSGAPEMLMARPARGFLGRSRA